MNNKSYIFFMVVLIIIYGCTKTKMEGEGQYSIIKLSWNKSYPNQTIEDVIKGFNWALSNIGASKRTERSHHIELSGNLITLNTDELNFESNGRKSILKLNKSVFNSEEYRKKGSIDVGRYVCLIVGASEHYYELVGIPNKVELILSEYNLLSVKGKVNNSSVSFKDRIIEYSSQNSGKQLFISTEMDSNEILELETIEIMNNGKLKFGVFDKNGFRKNASDPLNTSAGKMAKCMWCHESNIAPLFNSQSNFSGYLPPQQLQDTLLKYKNKLFDYQKSLSRSLVDFEELQEHTKMELLYISFMEPSAERLSNEWGMSITDVVLTLNHLQTHSHSEFPFLGQLYNRVDVESHSPFKALEVSSSVREKSLIEVNHL